jgi:gas vesicle protein
VANERHTAAFVVGLALGGLAGAGYVLFKTPRSGAAVRAGFAARIQGVVGTVKETAGTVGVETLRAGEQTVGRLEATGAAVRDRLPGMSGVADLVPGNRGEGGSSSDTTAPPLRPDMPVGADEMSDAIAGEAGQPSQPGRSSAPEAGGSAVAPQVADESLEAVAEANLTNLPSATLAESQSPDPDGVEPAKPPERAVNSSG